MFLKCPFLISYWIINLIYNSSWFYSSPWIWTWRRRMAILQVSTFFAYGHIQDNIFLTHKSLLKGIFEGFYACQVHSKVFFKYFLVKKVSLESIFMNYVYCMD